MVNGNKAIRKLHRKAQLQKTVLHLKNLRKEAAFHVRMTPQYIKFAIDYTTDPQTKSVIPSIIIFYILCAANGWYNTFVVTVPTQVLEESLSPFQYDTFVWTTFIAPLLTLFGMCMRGKFEFFGAWMQLTGNLGVAAVTWTYIASLIYTQYWGKGNFGGTWVLASALGAIVFCIRDIRRLADGDRWEKH